MPAVLPFASLPQPFDQSYDISAALPEVKWAGSRDAKSYNVFFGKTSVPPFVTNQSNTDYSLPTLETGVTYYWRVDAVTDTGIAQGVIVPRPVIG